MQIVYHTSLEIFIYIHIFLATASGRIYTDTGNVHLISNHKLIVKNDIVTVRIWSSGLDLTNYTSVQI